MHEAPARPSYADLLHHTKQTMREMLDQATSVIDMKFGLDYAKKNPRLLEAVASIGFEEFKILRAHHGSFLAAKDMRR